MDSKGSFLVNLTKNSDYMNGWPSWHPSGGSVIFSAKVNDKFQIYSVQENGSNLTHLIKSNFDDRRAYWSKDKRMIVFDRTVSGTVTDLFIAYFDQ